VRDITYKLLKGYRTEVGYEPSVKREAVACSPTFMDTLRT
jgi:hypothetical protein